MDKDMKKFLIKIFVVLIICMIPLIWLGQQQRLITVQYTIVDKYTDIGGGGMFSVYTRYRFVLDDGSDVGTDREIWNMKNVGDTVNITEFRWSWEL